MEKPNFCSEPFDSANVGDAKGRKVAKEAAVDEHLQFAHKTTQEVEKSLNGQYNLEKTIPEILGFSAMSDTISATQVFPELENYDNKENE